MVTIYCIEDIDGLKYVGNTIQKLNIRLNNHRCHKKTKNRIDSSIMLNLDKCKIYSLEQCSPEQMREKKQYWINNTECVNQINAIVNKKEINRKYREKNKEKINEYNRQKYHENKDVTEC